MNFLKHIKHIFLFLLTFLLGGQTTCAKTELVLSQNQVSFSIEQTQKFQSLEKEIQPNIGFLKEKSKFGKSAGSSTRINCNFSKMSVGVLANAGANLAEYVNIRKYLGDGRVTVYLTGAEQKAFQEILKTGDPEVLKWINKMTDAEVDDFAEMVRGYKDNPNKFKDAIKSIDNFLGDGVNDGFMTYWTLTPKMKNGLSTVRTLKQEGKLLPTGNATEVHLATVQNYTAWGNFLNVPMRYNGHFGKYATRALKHMKEALSELRKVPQRNKAGDIVYSGRAYSQDDFKKLFVGNKGEEVPINKGFVSSSTDEKVAAHFANYKTSSSTNNVKVIRRIETKTGVYVDDLSDYGVNLGKTRHTNAPPIEQVQKEVLMEEGLFKQLSEPIPFTGPDGGTWYYIDFVELGKPLK